MLGQLQFLLRQPFLNAGFGSPDDIDEVGLWPRPRPHFLLHFSAIIRLALFQEGPAHRLDKAFLITILPTGRLAQSIVPTLYYHSLLEPCRLSAVPSLSWFGWGKQISTFKTFSSSHMIFFFLEIRPIPELNGNRVIMTKIQTGTKRCHKLSLELIRKKPQVSHRFQQIVSLSFYHNNRLVGC